MPRDDSTLIIDGPIIIARSKNPDGEYNDFMQSHLWKKRKGIMSGGLLAGIRKKQLLKKRFDHIKS